MKSELDRYKAAVESVLDVISDAEGFGVQIDPYKIHAAIRDTFEHDEVIIDKADLPDVIEHANGTIQAGGIAIDKSAHAGDFMDSTLERLALALHLQSRESEAAARQARRDELVHQYGYDLTYADQSPMVKDLINRLISANADHTRAAEAEVERLKGEGR